MSNEPQVVVVIRPFHELGLTLCRLLALEGMRVLVLDRDPAMGEAFCRRLGLEGISATYRYVDPDLEQGENRIRQDLDDVYGRIRALVTFFEPIPSQRRMNWLNLAPGLASQLVQRAFDWRLRLLRAMTPLIAGGDTGIVLNVMMGQGDADTSSRPDALVAQLLNDLLEPEWSRMGIQVRQVATALGSHTPGARDDEMDLLNRDVGRVLDLVGDLHPSAR